MASSNNKNATSPSPQILAQVYNDNNNDSDSDRKTDPTIPAPPNNHDEDYNIDDDDTKPPDRHRLLALSRANRAGFLANVILLAGYTFGLWFAHYEFNGRDRETFALFLYFLTFALLILSGAIEFGVDVFSTRTVGHGRYHADSVSWNRVISALFIGAGILDIVAFVYWMQRDFDAEDAVLLVSSYILLVMAVLALYFHTKEIGSFQSWKTKTVRSDKIDFMANGLVFVTSVAGVVLRHMEYSGEDFGDTTDEMELALVPLWWFSSVLYVTTDVMRLKQGILD